MHGISPDGIIRSITDNLPFTSANIKRWVTSGPFELPQMVDNYFSVDPVEPILLR